MADRVAGVCYVKVDGRQLAIKGGLTVSPSRYERTGVAGQDRVHGYKEMPRVPYMEMDVTDLGDVSIEDIDAITNATVTAELANGKVFVAREAWTANVREINTTEGQYQLRFEAVEIEELGRNG